MMILVTGSAGFIRYHVATACLACVRSAKWMPFRNVTT